MEVPPKRNYKYCLVPTCSTTTIKNPSKRFLSIPLREPRRSAWLTAIRYFGNISSKTHHYVCEDHFKLEEDADNYTKMTFFPETRVVLKPHVVPHIFECKPSISADQLPQEQTTQARAQRTSRKNPFFSLAKRTPTMRSTAFLSRKRKKSVVVVKVEDSDSDTTFSPNQPAPEIVLPYNVSKASGSTDDESDSDTSSQTEEQTESVKVVLPTKQPTQESCVDLKNFSKYSTMPRKQKSRLKKPKIAFFDKETQTDFERCNIGIMARPLVTSTFVQCDLGSQNGSVDNGTSP